VLTGWRPPVEKIALVNLLRRSASLSLTEAAQAVDRCLRGETVPLSVPSRSAAEAQIRDVSNLGVRAELERAAAARRPA
jgi:hypothetical protein